MESAYGLHVVWIHERVAERQLSFDQVRDRVRYEWMRDREQARLRKVLDELRDDYVTHVARAEVGAKQ